MVSKERIRLACDLLSTKSGHVSSPLTESSTSHSAPPSIKNAHSANQIEIIDLTIDDDDDAENLQEQVSIPMITTTDIKAAPIEEPQLPAGGGVQRLSLAYHANNHSCAKLHELLETLGVKEKEELARNVKVYKPGMKVGLLLSMHSLPYTHTLTECRSRLCAS